MNDFEWSLVTPSAILAAFGLLVLLLSPFYRRQSSILAVAAFFGVVLSGFSTWQLWKAWLLARAAGQELVTAAGMVRVDGFGLFLTFVVLVVGALSLILSVRFLEREEADHGEFYGLLLLVLCGMVLMLHTTHLMTILVGLEIFSVALYVLCGLTRTRPRSIESALKYFLLGAFSSGFFVYGLALLYGAAGSLDLEAIAEAAAAGPRPLLWVGMGLVFVAFAFKVAVVPFHQWVPDVYEGAPTNVTGFMAAATKTVAFAALIRLLVGAFAGQESLWVPMVTVFSILTMTVANLVALAQWNIKRLLAFSSIAHAGYLLIGVVCGATGVQAVLYYLAIYGFMTVGAFAVAAAVGRGDARSERGYDLASWAGLARRQPVLATAMTVFLFSMAGMPPTGGFLGKYLIFQAAIESEAYVLAVLGMINAVIAAYYYLKVIVAMWMREPEEGEEPVAQSVAPGVAAVLVIATVAIFWLGIVPGGVLRMTETLSAYVL